MRPGNLSPRDLKNTLETWPRKPILTAIDTPISISIADHLTQDEREQLLQTVEMFKVVTQANPDDYQSLEILKEAYWKVGQQAEGLAVTRQLADTYMRLGQYSSAMLEYEGILLHVPDSADVQDILAELEEKLHQNKTGAPKASIAMDFGVAEEPPAAGEPSIALPPVTETAVPAATPEPTLIATAATRLPIVAQTPTAAALDNDGNEPLARFLVQHRLASHEVVNAALQRVRTHNAGMKPETPGIIAGLLEEIIASGVDAQTLLASIVDRTKCAYVPLEFYDIDRQIVKILPENLTLGRRIVPFDIVSRTMMVATDNPFDAAAKTLVQQSVDYHVQWHLAAPGVMHHILRDCYRIAE